MGPESKYRPGHQAQRHRQQRGAQPARRINDLLDAVALARRPKAERCPDQKATKQQQVGQHAVGQQVRYGPGLDGQHHGVMQTGLDAVARHIGSHQQHHRQQHQQGRCMARPDGRGPQHNRLHAGQAVAPDNQDETHHRSHRVEALVGIGTQPLAHTRAPWFSEHAHRMHTQEDNEAQDQCSHEVAFRRVSVLVIVAPEAWHEPGMRLAYAWHAPKAALHSGPT